MGALRYLGISSSIIIAASVLAVGSPASASDEDPRPGEGGADIATPGFTANSQVREGLPSVPDAVAAEVQPDIDDFFYDDLRTVGTAAEVCTGGLRSGTLAAYQALVSRFGGTPGTMYYCRERYAVQERAECNGQTADPVRTPTFFSDCWSNHAQGRAFDIMVGTSGGGYNQARGNAIVNFLLATDAAGNQNANARRLGVQQILWNDRCWNSDGDRGVASAGAMRPCGYGHFDHVHVDLDIAGAEGWTTWWGGAPQRAPKLNSLWFRATNSGAWEWRALVNLFAVSARSGSFPSRFSKVVRGDWNSDGVSNELFAWDPSSGEYRLIDGTTGAELRAGAASPAVDQFVNGDFDGDGLLNDMILFDTETGYGTLWTWGPYGLYGRSEWQWGPGWDKVVALDGNSDGRVGEAFLFDQESGVWYVFSWAGGPPYYLSAGTFVNVWDDVVAGDLDAQGNMDDLFLRDRESGVWVILNWYSAPPTLAIPNQILSGTWLREWDQFAIGDWDTDGRNDEMFIYDRDGGSWTMVSWHRYRYNHVINSSYVPGLDSFLAGTFG